MVEWKKLGEVSSILRGKRVTKGELIDNGIYPVISGGVTPMGYINSYNREPNTITISQYGTAGFVDYQHSRFWANDICYCVYPNNDLDNKYLWYVLKDKQDMLYAIRNTDAIPYSLPVETLNSVSIPIPTLSEQQRIVGILDTFTASIDNLKEKIAQRRKQYEYYRDQLLDLEGKEGVEMKKLGDVVKVLRGKRLTKNMLDDDAPYPVFHGGIEPLGFYNQYNRQANTVMVINVGASAGTVGYCNRQFWSSDGCFCISHSDLLNSKYLYYYLETKTLYLQSQVRHAGIPTLNNPVVESVYFPLLPLQEQRRIVTILDTFESSIQNLESQLTQRKKQYEYYRNKLLTFE